MFTFHSNNVRYPQVDTFADLPDATTHIGQVCLVKSATGVIFINRKRSGLYLSDGESWNRLGKVQLAGSEDAEPAGYLPSNPPSGKYVLTNLFLDPALNKMVVKYKT